MTSDAVLRNHSRWPLSSELLNVALIAIALALCFFSQEAKSESQYSQETRSNPLNKLNALCALYNHTKPKLGNASAECNQIGKTNRDTVSSVSDQTLNDLSDKIGKSFKLIGSSVGNFSGALYSRSRYCELSEVESNISIALNKNGEDDGIGFIANCGESVGDFEKIVIDRSARLQIIQVKWHNEVFAGYLVFDGKHLWLSFIGFEPRGSKASKPIKLLKNS
jgi:hypothetical protein